MTTLEEIQFRGGALSYQGALHVPAGGGPWPGVVICHADPQRGGSMDLPICRAVAEECARQDLIALRFNFRGVGASTGTPTGGVGEAEDVRAARDFLMLHPWLSGPCLGLVGYSFGGWVGLRVAAEEPERICALAAIGFGATLVGEDEAPPVYARPKCFVHGERDQVVSLARFEAFYARLSEPKVKHVLGADHFFVGREREVAEIVVGFLKEMI